MQRVSKALASFFSASKRGISILLLFLGVCFASFSSCREEKENPLAAYCGEEKPPPSHPQPYNELRTKPVSPPYSEVSYVWYCLEGSFVQETWTKTQKGCWVKEEEYRRPNPGCAS